MIDPEELRLSALRVLAESMSQVVVEGCMPDGVVIVGNNDSDLAQKACEFIGSNAHLSALPIVTAGIGLQEMPEGVKAFCAAGHGANDKQKVNAIARCIGEGQLGRRPLLLTPLMNARWYAGLLMGHRSELVGLTVQAVHIPAVTLDREQLYWGIGPILTFSQAMIKATQDKVLTDDHFGPGGRARMAFDLFGRV